jgi:hypothetical protein
MKSEVKRQPQPFPFLGFTRVADLSGAGYF